MNGFRGEWRHPRNNLDSEVFGELLIFYTLSQQNRFRGARYTTSEEFAREVGRSLPRVRTLQRVRTFLTIMKKVGIIEDRFELLDLSPKFLDV